MSDPTNLFNGEQPPATPPAAATPPSNGLEDLLKNIKNESGEQKYKTLEDALVALDHSQKYIPELKNQLTGTQTELERIKTEMTKFNNIEESVQRLLAQQNQEGGRQPAANGLDEQAVIKLVQQGLMQSKQAESAVANQQKVNDALVSKFGDKALNVLQSKAAELHTTKEALGELAKQSPDLVLALFNTSAHKEPNPTIGALRTPVPKPPAAEITKPNKSMLIGVGMKEQAAYLDQIRQSVYEKHGINS